MIAIGDVCSVADTRAVWAQTGAAGLMLGRGAQADPHLRWLKSMKKAKRVAELLSLIEG